MVIGVFIPYLRANLVLTGSACKFIHDPWRPPLATSNYAKNALITVPGIEPRDRQWDSLKALA